MNALWGMLVVNKPANMSSKDVSRWLIKRLGKLHIGHVGTLDPMAEGVLPILLGKATRLQDYLLNSNKIYEFDVQFGKETDTLDRAGIVVKQMEYGHITEEMLRDFCSVLHGEWAQETPVYSAVKYKGKALYQYARSGQAEAIPDDILQRKVFINDMALLRYDRETGIGTFKTSCSAGTYVRALAKEIALKVNSCGYVVRLVRLEACGVDIYAGFTLDQIEQKIDCLADLLVPIENMKLNLPRLKLKAPEQQKRLLGGQRLSFGSNLFGANELKCLCEAGIALIMDDEDRLFALGDIQLAVDGFTLHMKRMLI